MAALETRARIRLLCVWAGPVMIVAYLVAFWAIAGFIPPPRPSLSAAQVAQLYDEHRTAIRVGMVLCLVASTLILPFFAMVSLQIARVEGAQPVMAIVQFAGATLLEVFFVLCSMLWITASFRGELDPGTIRALHDLGWLIFVMVFPAYVLQMACIGTAALIDASPDPVWPRWYGFASLWVGLGGMGGGLAVFFKHGPFAWNGLIGFYVPIGLFAVWMLTTTVLLHRGVVREALAAAPAPAR